jgi:hypothetical protein
MDGGTWSWWVRRTGHCFRRGGTLGVLGKRRVGGDDPEIPDEHGVLFHNFQIESVVMW